MNIIGGSASSTIAHDVSKILRAHLVKTDIKRFPDGELYLRITESIKDQDIAIIQTTCPDENIIELFLLLDAAKRAGAETITVVIPYFGYARQDKQFKEGEPISAQALAAILSFNATTVITIDPHKEHILDFFSVPARSISAVPLLSEYLKDKHIDVVLAPDKGALDRARKAADILHCDVDYLEKTRIDGSTIRITPKSLDVCQKQVAIIDDIISTGGTMAAAIKQLKTQHASKVFVSCTHGLFAGTAIEKLRHAGCDEIIATDTIISPFSTVKTAPLIAKELKSLSR